MTHSVEFYEHKMDEAIRDNLDMMQNLLVKQLSSNEIELIHKDKSPLDALARHDTNPAVFDIAQQIALNATSSLMSTYERMRSSRHHHFGLFTSDNVKLRIQQARNIQRVNEIPASDTALDQKVKTIVMLFENGPTGRHGDYTNMCRAIVQKTQGLHWWDQSNDYKHQLDLPVTEETRPLLIRTP